MISLEQANEVVLYRSVGTSYDTIAERVGISLPTVIKICKTRHNDICKAREIARKAVITSASEYVKKRSKIYFELLQNACDELLSRDFSKMSTKELISMIKSLEQTTAIIQDSECQEVDKVSNSLSNLSDEDLRKLARAEYGE